MKGGIYRLQNNLSQMHLLKGYFKGSTLGNFERGQNWDIQWKWNQESCVA